MNFLRRSLVRSIKPHIGPRLLPVSRHTTTVPASSFPVSAMSYSSHWQPNLYPSARRSDHVDTYASELHGQVRVPDPYEWLERDSDETQAWVTAQEAYTRSFLDANPDRTLLEDEIRKSTNYERVRLSRFRL